MYFDSSSSGNQGRRKKPRPQTSRKKIIVSHLMMRSVTDGDAGVYKCLAKSVVGEDSAQALIRVVPRKSVALGFDLQLYLLKSYS